jgi:hypothetical protein
MAAVTSGCRFRQRACPRQGCGKLIRWGVDLRNETTRFIDCSPFGRWFFFPSLSAKDARGGIWLVVFRILEIEAACLVDNE